MYSTGRSISSLCHHEGYISILLILVRQLGYQCHKSTVRTIWNITNNKDALGLGRELQGSWERGADCTGLKQDCSNQVRKRDEQHEASGTAEMERKEPVRRCRDVGDKSFPEE